MNLIGWDHERSVSVKKQNAAKDERTKNQYFSLNARRRGVKVSHAAAVCLPMKASGAA
jgi:hypothetical protein